MVWMTLYFKVWTLNSSDRGWKVCRVNVRPGIRCLPACDVFSHNRQWGIVIKQFYKRRQPTRQEEVRHFDWPFLHKALTNSWDRTNWEDDLRTKPYLVHVLVAQLISGQKIFMWYLFGAKYCIKHLKIKKKKKRILYSLSPQKSSHSSKEDRHMNN